MAKLTKFQKIAIFVFLIVVALGFLDVLGKPFWDKAVLFGTFFWTFSYLIAVLISLFYYFFVHKDKSEAVSILVLFWGFLLSGIEDASFFIWEKIISIPHLGNAGWLPLENPYLYNTPVIGGISKLMGLSTVTPLSLFVSILIGSFITYHIAKYLYHKM